MKTRTSIFLLCSIFVMCAQAQKTVYGRITDMNYNAPCSFEGEGIKSVTGTDHRNRAYVIKFSESFNSVPSVVATALGKGNCYGFGGYQALTTVTVLDAHNDYIVLQPICPNRNSASSSSVSFIAIGD